PLVLFDLKRARTEGESPDLVLPETQITVAETTEDPRTIELKRAVRSTATTESLPFRVCARGKRLGVSRKCVSVFIERASKIWFKNVASTPTFSLSNGEIGRAHV